MLFERVMGTPGLGEFERLAAAVTLKECQFPELAERLLLQLLRDQPNYPYAHYEIGASRRWMGRTEEALPAYRRAVELAPDIFAFRLALVEVLHGLGRHEEADAQSALFRPQTTNERDRLDLLWSLAEYLRVFPKAYARTALAQVRTEYDWIGPREVAARIEAAVNNARPFSLIRLGDGEGAFARISDADEARFARLYGWMRAEWVRFLFGPDFDAEASGYADLTRGLMAAATEADVLGVPYPSWVEHEYALVSGRGIPCLLNVHRDLLMHPPSLRPAVCDQLVHVHLHNEGLIEPVLRKARGLTIISCLPGLDELIRGRFSLDDVELLPVPSEFTAPHLREANHRGGEAFPAAYKQIMRQLSQPQGGRVFIVAAGTLGKFYATAIKRHGGIALDLGSLVDGWMRLPSRPDYDGNLAL